MMSARQLTQPLDSLGWSWLTSAAGEARPGCPPPATGEHETGGFPRAAARSLPRGRGSASAGAARAFARAALQGWDITGECRDDIILVLSEMAANALRHTRPAAGRWHVAAGLLQRRRGSGILCAVTDPGPGEPRPRPAGRLGESSRGLQVIGALSDQWGYTAPGPAGKVVWAVLSPSAAWRSTFPS
jgi:anti-sigma regulatory factor (Ser/Thr protein kinase)